MAAPDPGSPLVSVIVPFFNTERFLADCLCSIREQQYQNLEVILADNVSTDGSAALAKEFARTDDRFRYVRFDEFVGHVANFNRSLTLISMDSAFCKIVFSDDWLYPGCIHHLVDVARRNPRAGIVSSYYVDGSRVRNVGLPTHTDTFPGAEVCRRQLLEGRFFMGTATTLLYRSSVVRSRCPFYPEGRLHEDTDVGYEILKDWDFGFVPQVLSFSRKRQGSISDSRGGFNPFLLDKLIQIVTHGPHFLTAKEYAKVHGEVERRYYRFLGGRMLIGAPNDFWDYHRAGLATVGRDLEATKIMLGVVRSLLNELRTPSLLVMRLGAAVRGRIRPRRTAVDCADEGGFTRPPTFLVKRPPD